jgi:hypothetical protein
MKLRHRLLVWSCGFDSWHLALWIAFAIAAGTALYEARQAVFYGRLYNKSMAVPVIYHK